MDAPRQSIDAHYQDAATDPQNLEEVVGRLERLAMAMRGRDMRASFAQSPAGDFRGDASTLNQTHASTFAQSPASTFAQTVYEEDTDEPTVIDTFSPRPMHREPSFTSQPPRGACQHSARAPEHVGQALGFGTLADVHVVVLFAWSFGLEERGGVVPRD